MALTAGTNRVFCKKGFSFEEECGIMYLPHNFISLAIVGTITRQLVLFLLLVFSQRLESEIVWQQ